MTKASLKRFTYRMMYGGLIDRRRAKRVQRVIDRNLSLHGNPWGKPLNDRAAWERANA